jgi:hypothetical protein
LKNIKRCTRKDEALDVSTLGQGFSMMPLSRTWSSDMRRRHRDGRSQRFNIKIRKEETATTSKTFCSIVLFQRDHQESIKLTDDGRNYFERAKHLSTTTRDFARSELQYLAEKLPRSVTYLPERN